MCKGRNLKLIRGKNVINKIEKKSKRNEISKINLLRYRSKCFLSWASNISTI